jgi:hypothetical protein
MWVSGIAGLLLFLTPGFFVLKYYALDKAGEDRRAASVSLAVIPAHDTAKRLAMDAAIKNLSPENLALECRIARQHADPTLRREAVIALGATLSVPGTNWKYPVECLLAKSTLADAATQDPDPAVRKAASDTLGQIAQHGAVIER